jgi:hypothetical protein
MIKKFPRNQKLILMAGVFSVLCWACGRDRLEVDLSDIPGEKVSIHRFERDLLLNREKLPGYAHTLKGRYGNFFDVYCKYIVRLGDAKDSSTWAALKSFAFDGDVDSVLKETNKRFPDLSTIENQLSEAFRYYRYHFPRKPVPALASFVSGFNYAVITGETFMGVGLDMYLGRDYEIYRQMGLPNYKIHGMDPKYIPADCMKGWIQSEYEPDPSRKDFLYQAVYYGKTLYFTDAMFPKMPDSLKIGYTPSQVEWCRSNEANIWAYMIEKKLLYSTNPAEYMKFIAEGPTTNGLPKESPAMLGRWTGWQIVRQYMEKNPSVTLEQLMKEKDPQKILSGSNYKPKR